MHKDVIIAFCHPAWAKRTLITINHENDMHHHLEVDYVMPVELPTL